MAFVRFAYCLLLVALPVTSLSILKFHQEDKDPAQDSFVSLEKELVLNNIQGRRLGVKELVLLESSKSLGGGIKEKISRKAFLSSNSIGESGEKKNKISWFERKKLGSGSALVYNNADYMTHMHHPPKHN